jgi:hypothetical protein
MKPKVFYMYKSDKPEKKFMIVYKNPETDREKKLYFGQTGYEHYGSGHKDDDRKARYIKRHRGMGEKWRDPTTPGFYALHILWNKPTISASIKDTMEKFDIKIIRKRS